MRAVSSKMPLKTAGSARSPPTDTSPFVFSRVNSFSEMEESMKNEGKEVATKLKDLEERVDNLYELRDGYFQSHLVQDAEKKWEEVEKELEKVMKAFGNVKKRMDPKERALHLYHLGRALNVLNVHRPESEEFLAKAIKLDSRLYQAWNELGESYWKRNSLAEARNCFLGAMEQERNKQSLRNLSMLMRTRDFWDLKNGMAYAKEAVELDPGDGKSWLVLGNAYTCLYSVKQDPKILEMCKRAYRLAEKDERVRRDPCLHFNRGVVEKFQEDYSGALSSFEAAQSLDPTWKEPGLEKSKLLDYLDRAHGFVSDKARLKGKRLKTVTRAANPRDRVKCVCVSDLKTGGNQGKVLAGVVSATFPDESRFNLVLTDSRESSAVVNVYNLPADRSILVGSAVSVRDPALSRVRVARAGLKYEFDAIRVDNPSDMTVNGKPIISTKKNIYFSPTLLPD